MNRILLTLTIALAANAQAQVYTYQQAQAIHQQLLSQDIGPAPALPNAAMIQHIPDVRVFKLWKGSYSTPQAFPYDIAPAWIAEMAWTTKNSIGVLCEYHQRLFYAKEKLVKRDGSFIFRAVDQPPFGKLTDDQRNRAIGLGRALTAKYYQNGYLSLDGAAWTKDVLPQSGTYNRLVNEALIESGINSHDDAQAFRQTVYKAVLDAEEVLSAQ